MDYRQLQLFLATAERLNLSHAAEAMSITQPGLSKSMHRLQSELGTKLYHRRGRGIELTESGRALLRHVKLIETQLADARSEVIGIAGGKLGHARIGAGPSWLSRHLPESIARVMQQNPNMRFTVDTGFPDRLIGRLRLGELDVVVGALPDNRVDPDLRFMRLSSDVIRVVGRKEHPLGAQARPVACRLCGPALDPARSPGARAPAAPARAFMLAGLPEPMLAVETDSLSLEACHAAHDRLPGLTTTQILSQDEAQGVVALDHEHLQFTPRGGHHQPPACGPVAVREAGALPSCARSPPSTARTEPTGVAFQVAAAARRRRSLRTSRVPIYVAQVMVSATQRRLLGRRKLASIFAARGSYTSGARNGACERDAALAPDGNGQQTQLRAAGASGDTVTRAIRRKQWLTPALRVTRRQMLRAGCRLALHPLHAERRARRPPRAAGSRSRA